MARYITVTPQYNPFSLQELMALPMLYTQAYDKAEEKYNELQDKAAVIRAYAKNSPKASAMLANYDRDMQAVADAIATGRWTANMADKATKLRSYYRDNIIPIQTGITAWEADRQNRQKLGMYGIGPNYSLDDFIANPALAPSYLDGNDIQTEAQKAAAADASTRNIHSGWHLDPNRGGQYWVAQTGTGYTDAEKAAFLQDPDNEYFSNLSYIKNQLRSKYGYDNKTPEEQSQIDKYIMAGIYRGMTGSFKQVESPNKGYIKPGSGDDDDEDGSSSKGSKKKPKFPGVVSVDNMLTESKIVDKPIYTTNTKTGETKKKSNYVRENVTRNRNDVVNTVNAVKPDNAISISVEDVKTYMPNQYYQIFSNNPKNGYELASKDHLYNFYYVPEISDEVLDATLGRFTGNLNVTVNEKPSGKLYVVPKKVDTKQPNRTYNGELL